ncbi:hypothetical protein ONA91_15470 [Micromonospora sp. DR5-3]|uniref:hypothetical protein n=1 Tax=unclassified Micromonospora TaxID=2617518 RepID=UPI0011D3B58A|nr:MULTISPECIES: hypothetical protein [unclassified Micromonospora]MCW3815843.1 hypothetical protein [Micromonospora sp. DR5-3]TYC24360.1 hypothetical protein FXF52_10110 [Micromonospora sp. MP36]
MSAVLADFSVLNPVTDEDLALAARAVRVHAPEPWPHGLLCRSECFPYPCRLARGGHAALDSAGLTAEQLTAGLVGDQREAEEQGQAKDQTR